VVSDVKPKQDQTYLYARHYKVSF